MKEERKLPLFLTVSGGQPVCGKPPLAVMKELTELLFERPFAKNTFGQLETC